MYYIFSSFDTLINCSGRISDEQRIIEKDKSKKDKAEKSVELEKEFKSKNLVFSYLRSDAWHIPICGIDVYSTFNNNIKCKIYFQDDVTLYTIEESKIDLIYETVRKNSEKLKSDDYFIEDAGTYDGYMYKILMSDNDNIYDFGVDNIQDHIGKDAPNANILISILKSIFLIFKECNVDEKYLDHEYWL